MTNERKPLTGLSLSRKIGQRVVLEIDGRQVWLEIAGGGQGGEVNLKFQAPPTVGIWREEVWERRNGSAG